MEPRNLVVVVRVTTACPMACLHCGFSRELRRPRRELSWPALMQFGHALADYQQRFSNQVHVSWLGGEPLVWSHLQTATDYFHDQLGLSLGMTTSGVPFSPRQTRRLIWLTSQFEQLTISLDGFASSHDQLRQFPGLHQQLRELIKQLAKARIGRRPTLRVNTVLTRSNIDQFPEFARELADWGVNELTFNQLGGNDRPEYFQANCLMANQVDRFCDELGSLRDELASKGLLIAGSESYLQRIRATSRGETILVEDCDPGRDFLFVDELGRVSPCSFTSLALGLPMDSLRNGEDVDRLSRRFASARNHCRPTVCRDCPATHFHQKFAAGRLPVSMVADRSEPTLWPRGLAEN